MRLAYPGPQENTQRHARCDNQVTKEMKYATDIDG